jgi:hypothetical protein
MSAPLSPQLQARLDQLCSEGWEIFERFDLEVRDKRFHPFVAAEYEKVLDALIAARSPGLRFLELGSASGVITVMADLLGFEAYGIELDASLVRTAEGLATRFDSKARFVNGSFFPSGFKVNAPRGKGMAAAPASIWNVEGGESAYPELGLALDDFDLVFGFPWGGEAFTMLELMKSYGNRNATLLLYTVDEGVRSHRFR